MKFYMNFRNEFVSAWKRCMAVGVIIASVTAFSAASIPVQSFHKDADGVTLTMSPGTMKLTVCSDSIVRVMYSPAASSACGTGLRGDEPFLEEAIIQGGGCRRSIDAHHAGN